MSLDHQHIQIARKQHKFSKRRKQSERNNTNENYENREDDFQQGKIILLIFSVLMHKPRPIHKA